MSRTRYADYPDHPLREIPQAVLDAARAAVSEAAGAGDVDPEQIEPIADAVVLAVLPAMRAWLTEGGAA